MGLVAWIVFGALAGWVASIIAGTNRRQGCLFDVIVGGRGISFGFNLTSFVVAVVGAIILLVITGASRRGRR